MAESQKISKKPELRTLPVIDDSSSVGYNPSVLVKNTKDEQPSSSLSAYQRYVQFPYEDWKPVRQRVEFVRRYATGRSLIDIACGGNPVTEEVKIPYKVGVDISPKAKELAKGKFHNFYQMDFEATPIEELEEKLGTYDTVVASEFLEHTFNPQETIEKLSALMNTENPYAKLLITIPNGESLAGKIDRLRNKGEWKRFKTFHRNHVSLLHLREWEKLFKQAGLEIKTFDFRPSDIVEGFPKETAPGWKSLCSALPEYLAHQYFWVLEKK